MNTKLAAVSAVLGVAAWWWFHPTDQTTDTALPVISITQQATAPWSPAEDAVDAMAWQQGASTQVTKVTLTDLAADPDPAQRVEAQTLIALLDVEAQAE